MEARRIAIIAAVGAAAAWALKALAIWIAGGLDQSPLEAPFFLVGLVALVTAVASLAVATTSGKPLTLRIVGDVGGGLIGLVLVALIADVVGELVPDTAGWVQEEAGLWVVALVVLIAVLAWPWPHRRSRAHVRKR